MNKIFFTPGPSALYFTVAQHVQAAFRRDVPSISHRSKAYMKIHQQTVEVLQALLVLPSDFTVGFTASATEVWDRISESLIHQHVCHLVNGAFSEKFYKAALAKGKTAHLQAVPPGKNHDLSVCHIPEHTELIAVVQNETSTGAATPVEDLARLRQRFPDPLIAVDAVSALPIPEVNFNHLDSLYFSVQKSFGLPAGLGVWLFNERCIAKAERLQAEGYAQASYNSLLKIAQMAKRHQTTCTPNVLNIYLLGKVAEDMLHKGIDRIRQEARYKSELLYQLFARHARLSPFVQEPRYQSMTTAVAQVGGGSAGLLAQLQAKGLYVGSGYGAFKNEHIRIANFPTHSKEQMEMLVDTVNHMDL